MISYFEQPVEQYYYINLIPEFIIFGHSVHFYFYLILVLFFSFFLIFNRTMILKLLPKIKFSKMLIYLIIFFITLLAVKWMIIQVNWLKNDFRDFHGQDFNYRQNKIITRAVIKSRDLPKQWHNFFDFLEFCKTKLPLKSNIYVLPYHWTFQAVAKYYLYPDLILTDNLKQTDYVISFNVVLPKNILGFEKFKQFEPNKLILKRIVN
ncbi:hypothetical protein ISS06_02290 [Patescibacteria group bacterium]|nr:hypothetical protein [Patescibacteria group bacterium]